MYNAMNVPCPKCNPKGHKSKSKEKYISTTPICGVCFGTHYLDWMELATGGKKQHGVTTKLWNGASISSGFIPEIPKKKKSYLRTNNKGVKQNWIKQ